jgi:ATP-binding cassette, subfamily B, bacterial MsbA
MMTVLLRRIWDLSPQAAELLVDLIRQHRRYVIVSFIAAFISALMEGGTLALLALALESLGSGELSGAGEAAARASETIGLGREDMFIGLVGAAVLSQVLHSGLAFVSDVANATLQAKVERAARIRIFDRFLDLSYADARSQRIGELSSHMDQVNFLGMALNRMHEVVQQLLMLLVYVVLLFWLSWQATLISTAAMVVLSLVMRVLVRRVRSAANGYKSSVVRVTGQAVEFLNGLRIIQTFGREQFARSSIRGAIDDCSRARRRGLIWHATIAPTIQAISVCVVGTLLAVGFAMYGHTDRTKLIELTGFLLVIFRSAPRLSLLNKSRGLLASYLPFFERISELLRTSDQDNRHKGTQPFTGLRDAVEFADVSFRYPTSDESAVKHLQFTIRRGQMIALVGESGAGKTTIADLLLGLYPVTSGAILVDGVPLDELEWDAWRSRLGVVSQDTFLLSGSVRDNIAFGKLEATNAEIEAAARAAYAHEFITQMEAGYDTLLGEQGYRLSGGQRQRLAIARAILRDPDILILDEATSDLDSQSEALIQESLLRLRANRTVLVIAHRLSTIASADEILVLRNGCITERGRHATLIQTGGTYAQYVHLQTASTLPHEPG